MALVHPERVDDATVLRQIREITQGHISPEDYFVDTLALGIAKTRRPLPPWSGDRPV